MRLLARYLLIVLSLAAWGAVFCALGGCAATPKIPAPEPDVPQHIIYHNAVYQCRAAMTGPGELCEDSPNCHKTMMWVGPIGEVWLFVLCDFDGDGDVDLMDMWRLMMGLGL